MLNRCLNKEVLLCLLAISILLHPACKREPKTTCIWGNNIPDKELLRMVDTGNRLMDLLIKREYKALYEAGCEMMKKSQTRDQFLTMMKFSDESFGQKDFPRLEEPYLIESEAKQDHVKVACNLGEKGADDIHQVVANRKIAALVYNTKAGYGILRIVMHLIWEDAQWKLYSVVQNPASIKGHLDGYYFKKARESREKNLLRLAFLQYQVAMLLSEMGPNVDEFAVRQYMKESRQIKVDYMPNNMVQIWETSEGNTYKVYNVGVLVSQGDLFVDISYITSSLEETEKIEKESRELIRFVREKFPEYEQGFDGLVISARSDHPKELYQVYRVVERFD
jgi:hypothetical protein